MVHQKNEERALLWKTTTSRASKKLGGSATTRADILLKASRYYEELYSLPKERTCEGMEIKDEYGAAVPDKPLLPDEPFLPIRKQKIGVTLKKLKIGEASGPDKIENETLKEFAEVLAEPLAQLFNRIIAEEAISKQWKKSDIILLHKKRDKKS